MSALSDAVVDAARTLSEQVDALSFAPPTEYIYNPLDYAWDAHVQYLERFAATKKRILFLGMNPGPFGMAQIGVPFGEVGLAHEWLGLYSLVRKPKNEHPKRPIDGFSCQRSEVSGQRLWGLFKERFVTAERFAESHFVTNYCPLVFMEATGRNRTPDKLPAAEVAPLYAACDVHLRRVVELLEPEWLVGVGAFAETRAKIALADMGVQIGRILHPSPASPVANRGWGPQATAQMEALGLWQCV